jgi:hypothetical protein
MAPARGGGRKKRKPGPPPSITALFAQAHTLVGNAYADTSKRNVKTALRAWMEFESTYQETGGEKQRAVDSLRPKKRRARRMLQRPRYYGDIAASLHNETSLILFAGWMHSHDLSPSTVTTYLSLVKTNLALAMGFTLTVRDLELRLPRMLKGLRRLKKLCRKRRLGWRAAYERRIHQAIGPPTDLCGHAQKAMRCTLRQGLMRGADILPEKMFKVDRHATMGDLEWFEQPSRHARLTVLPAKKSEQQGKTELVYFPEGDGVTDAYTALKEYLDERLKRCGHELHEAPLFLDCAGRTAQVKHARALFKASGKVIGIPEGDMGSHAGRIGGATDLFAADAPEALLQMCGRWVSVTGV